MPPTVSDPVHAIISMAQARRDMIAIDVPLLLAPGRRGSKRIQGYELSLHVFVPRHDAVIP